MEIYYDDLNKETQKQLEENGLNMVKVQNGDAIGELFEDMINETN